MRKKKWMIAVFISLCFLCCPKPVFAYGTDSSGTYGQGGEESDTFLDEMMESVDFAELDGFLEKEDLGMEEKICFSDLVGEMLEEGLTGFDYSRMMEWLKEALFAEVDKNRKLLIEVVLLAIGFSILKNFSEAFGSSYVSDLCFLLVYCVLAVMLLQSFLSFQEIVKGALTDSVEFMKMAIPTFCITMVFSAGSSSSAGFYQTAFLVIYLVEWLFLNLLIPMIHIYVLMELFNHFFEDEKFANLTELLKGAVCWGMKIAGIVVLGLNVVQGLINPAKDALLNGTVGKAASMIPGVGNTINGVTELLLGSGIMIKNCVGVAALLILVLISLVPMVKVACMALFYKLAAAVTEPITDKRIAGCLKGMADGGVLYLKLMGYCMMLFFLTIALTTAVSGVIC